MNICVLREDEVEFGRLFKINFPRARKNYTRLNDYTDDSVDEFENMQNICYSSNEVTD
ncbi:MAG: hypothetical protein GY861_12735 [bacterium]|nr:hypothetical protein [bacterium]